MRTELKIKRLLTKHSDLKKFVSGLIDIQIKARKQGLNPQPQFYEQYIGVEE